MNDEDSNLVNASVGPEEQVQPVSWPPGWVSPGEYGQLRDGWRDFLHIAGWDLYVTGTFRASTYRPEYVARQFRKWLSLWEEETAIRRGVAYWWKPDPTALKAFLRGPWVNSRKKKRASAVSTWAMVVEPHQKGDLHFHALIRCSEQLGKLDVELGKHLWSSPSNKGGMGMGLIDIQVPRVAANVQAYVTKDIWQEGYVDFSDPFNRW